MASVQSPTSFVFGHFRHGAVPHQPPATPTSPTGPLLWLFLVEAFPGASTGDDAGSWPYLPFHPQKQEVTDTTSTSISGYFCAVKVPFMLFISQVLLRWSF